MNVRMPDGTTITNVPDNITQSELLGRYNKYSSAGLEPGGAPTEERMAEVSAYNEANPQEPRKRSIYESMFGQPGSKLLPGAEPLKFAVDNPAVVASTAASLLAPEIAAPAALVSKLGPAAGQLFSQLAARVPAAFMGGAAGQEAGRQIGSVKSDPNAEISDILLDNIKAGGRMAAAEATGGMLSPVVSKIFAPGAAALKPELAAFAKERQIPVQPSTLSPNATAKTTEGALDAFFPSRLVNDTYRKKMVTRFNQLMTEIPEEVGQIQGNKVITPKAMEEIGGLLKASKSAGKELSEEFIDTIGRETEIPVESTLKVLRSINNSAVDPALREFASTKLSQLDKYGISHRPMTEATGSAKLFDLTKSFPDDIYSKDALRIYGSGDNREKNVLKLLQSLRGKPNEIVTIYRGVPDGVKKINPGDWVTLDMKVAEDYGKVISKKVKASDVTAWADSLLEFGYLPGGANINISKAVTANELETALRQVGGIKAKGDKKFLDQIREAIKKDFEAAGAPMEKLAESNVAFKENYGLTSPKFVKEIQNEIARGGDGTNLTVRLFRDGNEPFLNALAKEAGKDGGKISKETWDSLRAQNLQNMIFNSSIESQRMPGLRMLDGTKLEKIMDANKGALDIAYKDNPKAILAMRNLARLGKANALDAKEFEKGLSETFKLGNLTSAGGAVASAAAGHPGPLAGIIIGTPTSAALAMSLMKPNGWAKQWLTTGFEPVRTMEGIRLGSRLAFDKALGSDEN